MSDINQLTKFTSLMPVTLEVDQIGGMSSWTVGKGANHLARRIEEEGGVVRVFLNNGLVVVFTGSGYGIMDKRKELEAEQKAEKDAKKEAKKTPAGVLKGGK